jgi:hypothetical protein
MRLFRFVPSSDFACFPPFPPSAQSLVLFPSLSIDRSIHPSALETCSFPYRRQSRSFPSLFPSLPSFLPFPSLPSLPLPCPCLRLSAVPGPVPGRPGTWRVFKVGKKKHKERVSLRFFCFFCLPKLNCTSFFFTQLFELISYQLSA